MTNRIDGKLVPDAPPEPGAPPVVKAFRSVAWRCPDCQLTQFSERSTTHIETCRRCKSSFTVDVKQ